MASGTGTFEKWLWVELIGFDNTLSDFGVGNFLGRMEIQPQAVVLLLYSPELIHQHTGLEKNFRIGLQHCSYCGRPYNEERERQDWTAFQLRGLVQRFAESGVATYISVFNIVTRHENKMKSFPDFDKWGESHPELFYQLADGKIADCICVWKHLSDGHFYEDFLVSCLPKFLQDYGFSGFMASDGYAQPRAPLNQGDFSEDMISQFSAFSNIKVPCGSVQRKAAFILSRYRDEWCRFHVMRQARFIKKIAAAVHSAGKKFAALSAWVRDPFEAIWRYGVDYRKLADAGTDTLVIESSAGTVELEGWNAGESTSMLDRNRAMLLRMRTQLPDMKFILLHCIKDGLEEYCVLRHAPPLAESEVLSLVSMRFADTGQRCVEGIMACLSDGISASEWNFLDHIWSLSFSTGEGMPHSPLLLWSDTALNRELAEYPKQRWCSSFRTTAELIAHGVPLAWSGTKKAAAMFPEAAVIIIHPAFWPEIELQTLLKRRAPVLFVGILPDGSFGSEIHNDGQIAESLRTSVAPVNTEESFFFWRTLPEAIPESEFWDKTAELVNHCIIGPRRGKRYNFFGLHDFSPESLRVWSFSDATLFASNMSGKYLLARIHTEHDVSAAKSLMPYPGMPVRIMKEPHAGLRLEVKLPPYGTVVMKLKYDEKETQDV